MDNSLEAEWRALPASARRSRLRRVLQRDVTLLFTRQWLRCVERTPDAARKLLWIFNWTTLGDAVMDLAARASVPASVTIDLCISPALAPLFEDDPRFDHVFTRIDDCGPAYDFVLLHEASSRSLADKRRRWPDAPFAAVLNTAMGERFARTAFCNARMRHLFGLAAATLPALAPTIELGKRVSRSRHFEVAVALGARDTRRRYPHWSALLTALLEGWPGERRALRFTLLGSSNAYDDLASLAPALLTGHAVDRVGTTTILSAAQAIRDADAFLGTDGGLMHVAEALGRPGVALFAGIAPRLRLAAGSAIVGLAGESMAEHAPARVADAFIAACQADAFPPVTPA